MALPEHKSVLAADPDAPTLVVVFLRGGADGLTLVPPADDDVYRRARPLLGVAPSETLDLDGYFSLHRRLEKLLPFYREGQLAVVQGAGSTDRSRSHFAAQDTMEHGGNLGSGWLARYLRAQSAAPTALSAVAIGTKRPESLRGAPAGAVLQTLSDFDLYGSSLHDPSLQSLEEGAEAPQKNTSSADRFAADLARLYAATSAPLGAAADHTLAAIDRLRRLRANNATDGGTSYPDTPFGRGLREIARLVRAEVGLSVSTVDLDGWDTHFVQNELIDGLMDQLAVGIDAFWHDLGARRDRVTVAVLTEFGRRLRENASFGTDHGAGGTMLLLGETPWGGQVLSSWRDLEGTAFDEAGDVPVGIDYRDVLAPVLQNHAPTIDLQQVFPGHNIQPIAEPDAARG